ncbi:MAG: ankyrin repeat domain-containing protein [Planctomycetota bacterium]
MVSDEEIQKVLKKATELAKKSRDDFNNYVSQHPEVFEEQNRRNQTAHAARKNDVRTLEKNISENRDYLDMLFTGTPLICSAAQAGSLEACKFLIAAGADINQLTNDNNTALANVKLSLPLVEYLLSVGADPNNRNVFHVFTAYQDVPEKTRLEIVKLFVSHGLDVNRAYLMFNDPNSLQTVLDFLGKNFPTIREYLVSLGAKHASELENPGAYDSANEYLSYEKLKELRQRMKATSKQGGKS